MEEEEDCSKETTMQMEHVDPTRPMRLDGQAVVEEAVGILVDNSTCKWTPAQANLCKVAKERRKETMHTL